MDILSEILSSRIRAAILRLLFAFDVKELYMRDLERRSGFSIGAIQTELKKLLRLELLSKRKDGNRLYFRANKEHPLYPDLRNLVMKTNGLVDILKEALFRSDAIKYAFVFGSVARKEETASSDIDLMVVGDLGLRQVIGMLSGLSDRLLREINPHCMSAQDFVRRKKTGEPFVNRICEEAKLFVIGDENDFEAMA
ncbi:MAG: nucleotidyltransferase domain-containing protein [Desulfobacteraceae bacterium]|jgi:predicted nucleotidyltransferase|nr:nucleotidyltransferase domain-containing protein [Desulfobacteraceae bacterium]